MIRGGLLVLVAVATASLGCNPGSPEDANAFKVGLLTPGPVSDGGWNAGLRLDLLPTS